jgi:hypothetical protein
MRKLCEIEVLALCISVASCAEEESHKSVYEQPSACGLFEIGLSDSECLPSSSDNASGEWIDTDLFASEALALCIPLIRNKREKYTRMIRKLSK